MSSLTRAIRSSAKSLIMGSNAERVPSHLARRFGTLDASGTQAVTASLLQNYFTRQVWGDAVSAESYLASPEGDRDLQDHLSTRLTGFRRHVVPWLDSARRLDGATILEIGCGTGSSTVALAEQGAIVTAIDVDEPSLQVARDRCTAHGVQATFLHANATEVHERCRNRHFDFVIFFACLEHMTHNERVQAMRSTWDMLSTGDLWCLVETPNRLWFFDGHTSLMPFYHWLPDDLARRYASYSPRQPFNRGHRGEGCDAELAFLREGRGVSYHEFDIAMGRSEDLEVVSSLPIFQRARNPLWNFGRRLTSSTNSRFEALLREIGPPVHAGFYQSSLDLIIRKR